MADEVRKSDTIESLLAEDRTYPPPAEFTANALLSDAEVHDEAKADFEGFWAKQAGDAPRLVRGLGHRSSSGTCRSRSGSSAGS